MIFYYLTLIQNLGANISNKQKKVHQISQTRYFSGKPNYDTDFKPNVYNYE